MGNPTQVTAVPEPLGSLCCHCGHSAQSVPLCDRAPRKASPAAYPSMTLHTQPALGGGFLGAQSRSV